MQTLSSYDNDFGISSVGMWKPVVQDVQQSEEQIIDTGTFCPDWEPQCINFNTVLPESSSESARLGTYCSTSHWWLGGTALALKNSVVGWGKGESDKVGKTGNGGDICFARWKIWICVIWAFGIGRVTQLNQLPPSWNKHDHFICSIQQINFSANSVCQKIRSIAQPLTLLCFDSRKWNRWPCHEISSFYHPEELCHCWFLPNLRTSCPLPSLWPEKFRSQCQRTGNNTNWFPSPGCRPPAFTSQQSHWRTPQGSGHQTPAGQVPTASWL